LSADGADCADSWGFCGFCGGRAGKAGGWVPLEGGALLPTAQARCYTFPGRACARGGSVTGAVNWMVWPFRVAATAEGREGHGFLGVRKVFAVASGCYRSRGAVPARVSCTTRRTPYCTPALSCSRGAVPPRVICTTRRTSYCTPAQRRGYSKQPSLLQCVRRPARRRFPVVAALCRRA